MIKPLRLTWKLVWVGGCLATSLAAAADTKAIDAKTIEVRVAKLGRGDVIRYVTLPATVKANQQATLYAKVAGYLKAIKVDAGDTVKAGQELADIEVPELVADLTRYKTESKVAQAEYDRVSAAHRGAPDLIMPQQLDDAEGRRDIAKANLTRIEQLLSYSKITAPFGGVITTRYVDVGAFIPAATSGSTAQSAALLTLMDFNTVRLSVPVPEIEAPLVQVGQPVRIAIESLPGKTYNAKVSRYSFALDNASKTMHVEADLPNGDRTLRPGMYATVKVGVEKHLDVLTMPAAALVMEKTNAFAYTADGATAKKHPIKIGFNDGEQVEVVEGITSNESIILVGKLNLTDGAAISVQEGK